MKFLFIVIILGLVELEEIKLDYELKKENGKNFLVIKTPKKKKRKKHKSRKL